jgi:hypothetical protein
MCPDARIEIVCDEIKIAAKPRGEAYREKTDIPLWAIQTCEK